MRLVVTHPPDPRPVLIVETAPEADDAAVRHLRDHLHLRGCANGLLFSERECVILRDTWTTDGPESIREESRVRSDAVLGLSDPRRTLDERVSDWLRSMAASWHDTLPREPAVAAPFISDIVPAVSGASIRLVA